MAGLVRKGLVTKKVSKCSARGYEFCYEAVKTEKKS